MTILGVIPAAGLGTRFDSEVPKPLAATSAQGVTFLDLAIGKMKRFADDTAVITSERIVEHPNWKNLPGVEILLQDKPTGMGDAVFCAKDLISKASKLVVMWVDQVGLRPEVLALALDALSKIEGLGIAIPCVSVSNPYVELIWDEQGKLSGVLESREGAVPNPVGYSDVGLFALSAGSELIEAWERYCESENLSDATQERNFIPFLVWLSQNNWKTSFVHASEIDRIAVNTLHEFELAKRMGVI